MYMNQRTIRINVQRTRWNSCATCLNEILHSWLLLLMSLFTAFQFCRHKQLNLFNGMCAPCSSSVVCSLINHGWYVWFLFFFMQTLRINVCYIMHITFIGWWPMLFLVPANKLINRMTYNCSNCVCRIFGFGSISHTIRYATKLFVFFLFFLLLLLFD